MAGKRKAAEAGGAQQPWRNRIVGYGEVSTDQILANPQNWRIHPHTQTNALAGVLSEIGLVQNIIINKRTSEQWAPGDRHVETLIDGEARTLLALREGQSTLPVTYVDLTPGEEAEILATLDPIAALAAADKEKLASLLADVQSGEAAVMAMLSDLAAQHGVVPPDTSAPVEAPEPQLDRAEELRREWGVEVGQLWACGEHRVLCGDCTDGAIFQRLMGKDMAEMIWTDPPYGVAIGDKNKYLNTIARSNRVEENIDNDTLDEPALFSMLCTAFDHALAVCLPGGAWYVAAPPGPLHVLFGQALKERGIWHQTIQWVKNNATFSPMGVDYHWQAEPIFYGWRPGAGHRFHGGRTQTTVWNIDRPLASPEHPTMKPIALVQRSIENSSQQHDIVLDFFLGSGTTLVTCEGTSRICRGIEISPGYVAVTLQRYADLSGDRPRLLES